MEKKILFVCGNFDDFVGQSSKIILEVFNEINIGNKTLINGGNFEELEQIVKGISQYDIVFWFPSIANEKPKLVRQIKNINKKCILITSKRNIEKKYTFADLIFHALGLKSNLIIEFIKENSRYQGRIFDPLGNVFLDYTEDFHLIGMVLNKRVKELLQFTRIESKSMNEQKTIDIPNEEEFFDITRGYAILFHDLIHANPDATNRFFGNASFRCESGFLSFKQFPLNNFIFVSKRDIDKRYIGKDSFVPVKSDSLDRIDYLGVDKPSVDTPIHLRLYGYYSNIKYILHSHVYIKDAHFTGKIVPCGAIEEFYEIITMVPLKSTTNFVLNLRGHGSIALAKDISYLKHVYNRYIPRNPIEVHSDYKKLID